MGISHPFAGGEGPHPVMLIFHFWPFVFGSVFCCPLVCCYAVFLVHVSVTTMDSGWIAMAARSGWEH